MNMMNAILFYEYGNSDVLQLKKIPVPDIKENEVLIRIKASSINSGDWRVRKAEPFMVRLFFGLLKPKLNILGTVISGTVEKTGSKVTRFKAGDDVFGLSDFKMGAHAEYIALAETEAIVNKPESLSFEEAASIPFGAHTALYFLRLANLSPGQKILIYGASGAVGTNAVQIAKYFGAEVTAVCSSANVDLVKSLGADRVIDYTKEDISKFNEKYDVVMDTVNKIPIRILAQITKPGGTLLPVSAMLKEMFQSIWYSKKYKIRSQIGSAKVTFDDMKFLSEIIVTGKLKPVIDKIYKPSQIKEAYNYVETGHKKGNVILLLD